MKFHLGQIIPKKLFRLLQAYKYKLGLSSTKSFKGKENSAIFEQIYRSNYWGSESSHSGAGSEYAQTETLRIELNKLIHHYKIESILDIPCGDFHWMQNVNLDQVRYMGADIVPDIVEKNSALYTRDTISFNVLDITRDKLPKMDLIICRDCLVHFSYDNIYNAIRNIVQSDSKYLLTTSYPETKYNYDIITGDWRALNLEAHPFKFPNPIEIIIENCTEKGGGFTDKTLTLWEVSQLLPILDRR